MTCPNVVERVTHRQLGVRTLRAPHRPHGVTIMELIITSFIAATLLLVGHLAVLVHQRLFR
jgi:hypothetical protein